MQYSKDSEDNIISILLNEGFFVIPEIGYDYIFFKHLNNRTLQLFVNKENRMYDPRSMFSAQYILYRDFKTFDECQLPSIRQGEIILEGNPHRRLYEGFEFYKEVSVENFLSELNSVAIMFNIDLFI